MSTEDGTKKRTLWIVSSTERTYYVEGSEGFAEDVRRRKAMRHGAVFQKRRCTAEEAAQADREAQDLEAREER